MPYFLAQRATSCTERMDDPNCSRQALFNTYRQFSTVNSMISGWKTIYKSRLQPLFLKQSGTASLLDIGFGGGDIPVKLAKWAAQDGISLQITAIDTDPRSMDFVSSLNEPENVTFEQCSSTEILTQKRQFDVVISNHLLHHLGSKELKKLLLESKKLSSKLVLFNDIERSDMAYGLFNLFSRPLFWRSFITEDGLTSIKRSYTATELRKKTPNHWSIERLFPFRLLLSYTHD